MKRWLGTVVLGLCSVIFLMPIIPLCMNYIPRDFHPQAWALTIVGMILLFSAWKFFQNDNPDLSFLSLAWGWSAWIVALMDKACPSAFFGFLALALFYTYCYLKVLRYEPKPMRNSDIMENVLSLAIVFFITAVFLSIFPL